VGTLAFEEEDDTFIARLSVNGSFEWLRHVGGTEGFESCHGIVIDGDKIYTVEESDGFCSGIYEMDYNTIISKFSLDYLVLPDPYDMVWTDEEEWGPGQGRPRRRKRAIRNSTFKYTCPYHPRPNLNADYSHCNCGNNNFRCSYGPAAVSFTNSRDMV